jgi:hypothetical protein
MLFIETTFKLPKMPLKKPTNLVATTSKKPKSVAFRMQEREKGKEIAGQGARITFNVSTDFEMIMHPKSSLMEMSQQHDLSDPQDGKPAAIQKVSIL